MNKILRRTLAFVTSAFLLAGCTAPGSNTGKSGNEMLDSYSYTPDEEQSGEQVYEWLIKPSIRADNIISFDASRLDPEIADNKSYMNYSVIRQSGRYGLIDYAGNMIIKPDYDDYYVCPCGEVVLVHIINERLDEYEYCTIDTKKQISNYPVHTYDDYPVYYVDINTQKIFEGTHGEERVSEYTGKKSVAVTEANVTLDDYGNYIAEVPNGALCGMAKDGELLVECLYDAYYAPTYKSAGATCIAFRNSSNKWGYFDSDGNAVIDFICDGDPNAYNGMLTDDQMVSHPYLFCDEYVPVYKDGYYSYYDFEGSQVVRAGEFAQARPVNNGRAWVKQNDYWGVVKMGEIVEEEKPKEESSSSKDASSSSAASWTTTTPSDESSWYTGWNDTSYTDWGDWSYTDPGYTDWGNSGSTGWEDPGYTDPGNTDWGDPGYTDPGNTDWGDPGYTEPPAAYPPDDNYEY